MNTPGLSNPSPNGSPPPTHGGAWLRPLYTAVQHYYPKTDMGRVTICGKATAIARTVEPSGKAFGKRVERCFDCVLALATLMACEDDK